MVRHLTLGFMLSAVLFLAGCVRDAGTVSFVTTRDISPQNMNQPVQSGGRVEGKHTTRIISFIPTGRPDIAEAVQDALGKSRGTALRDARFTYSYWYIPLIYGEETLTVDGEVVT